MTHQIGPQLQKMRERVGLTQMDVAKTLKYASPQFVSNWERGVSMPALRTLPKIAKLYKVSQNRMVELMVEVEKTRISKLFKL